MDEALREGKIKILDRCAGGWAYFSGTGPIRQVIYTIMEQDSDIDRESFFKALSDTRERFPVVNRFLIQIENEFYCAEYEGAREDYLYTDERVIGGEENGFHSFDISMDKNRIILSVDHGLMDGSGLMEVTDFFCGRYTFHRGERAETDPSVDPGPIMDMDLFSLPQEEGYDPVSTFGTGALVPSFREDDLSELLELSFPTPEVLSLCKSLSSSPSILFALLLEEALEQTRGTDKGDIVVSLPVDYRDVLTAGSRMRVCAFPAIVNFSEEKWSNRSVKEKAAELRTYLRERRDPAFARGWIRFFKERTIPMNVFRSSHNKEVRSVGAYSFMLSYLRPSDRSVYHGKHLIYSGISAPNDFCLLEYEGSFHLYLRPFYNDRIIPAFRELCARNGWQVNERRTKGASFVSRPPKIERRQLPPSVFIFVSPAYGHVGPLLPLAGELVKRGFAVRVYTGGEMRAQVEKTGAVCISYDAYYAMGKTPEGSAYGFSRMLELAESMDEAIGADVRTFQPHFAIVDTMSVWGRLLAEKHGLKIVLSSATRIMNRDTIPGDFGDYFDKLWLHEEQIVEELKHLSDKGFKKASILSLLTPGTDTDCIVYIPEELQGNTQSINEDRVFFAGYSKDPMQEETRREAAADEGTAAEGSGLRFAAAEGSAAEGKNRPLIYVTMGTVSSRSAWFFRSAIAAFRTMDVDVVMAVWDHIVIGMLGKLPDNIHVYNKVDQEEILKKADAAIFHGGLGTIRDCLLCGVPMAVYPTVADQFGNSRMVKESGVGIALCDHKPDTLRRAAASILTEPAFRERAKALGERMRAMGGAVGAAEWICERMKYEAVYPFSPTLKHYYDMSGDKVWLCPNLVYLFNKIDLESLRMRYKQLIEKRQMLRAFPVFPERGEPYLAVRDRYEADELFFMDISSLKDAASQKQYLRSFMKDFRRKGFGPETPAFCAGLVKTGEKRFMLFLLFSHYILDAIGGQRVAEDLIGSHELYEDAGEVGHFYDTCASLADQPETVAYWERALKGVKGYTSLPFLIDTGKKARVIREKTELPKEPVQAFARKLHVGISAVIYAALGKAILKQSGLEEVCFATTGNRRIDYLTTDKKLTGMYAVEIPLVYHRGDTPEMCLKQLIGHWQHISYDFYRLGKRFAGRGTLPGVISCNFNSNFIAKGTIPDEFFLIDDVYENDAEKPFRGLEFFFVSAQVLYLHMVYNEKFISGEAADILKACFIETLYSMIDEGA